MAARVALPRVFAGDGWNFTQRKGEDQPESTTRRRRTGPGPSVEGSRVRRPLWVGIRMSPAHQGQPTRNLGDIGGLTVRTDPRDVSWERDEQGFQDVERDQSEACQ